MIDKTTIQKVGQLMNSVKGSQGGLSIDMINNKVRNNFYDQILKKCKNKKCIEVGIGSGLLSMIALEHGATHIIAFEKDLPTYNVVKYIIKYCNLEEKITLINEKFTSNSIEKHNLHDCELIFHELIGSNLWNDPGAPIRSTFDKKINIEIIPNKLITNFYVLEVEDNSIITNQLPSKMFIPKFNPGVKIDKKFIDSYNYCIEKYNNFNPFNEYRCLFKKILLQSSNEIKYYGVKKKSIKKIYTNCFDFNSSDYSKTKIKINLPKSKNPYILLPVYEIKCDEFSIKCNEAISNTEIFFILCNSDDVYFELNILNGLIKIDNIIALEKSLVW